MAVVLQVKASVNSRAPTRATGDSPADSVSSAAVLVLLLLALAVGGVIVANVVAPGAIVPAVPPHPRKHALRASSRVAGADGGPVLSKAQVCAAPRARVLCARTVTHMYTLCPSQVELKWGPAVRTCMHACMRSTGRLLAC